MPNIIWENILGKLMSKCNGIGTWCLIGNDLIIGNN